MPTAQQDFTHIVQTTKNGRLDTSTDLAHVRDLAARAARSGKPIVIHLHGGLVTKASAYATVNLLQPRYLDAGAFPIFVVWRTGIFDALKNVEEITKKPVFKKLMFRLLKFFVGKFAPGGKGLGSAADEPDDAELEVELAKLEAGEVPFATVAGTPAADGLMPFEQLYLEEALRQDAELNAAFDAEVDKAQLQPTAAGATIAEPKLDRDVVDEAAREREVVGKGVFSATLVVHALKVAGRVTKRFFRHTDHRLHATIIEEICRELFFDEVGTAVWGFMKQDAADTFASPGQSPERGGWLLLQLLDQEARALVAAGRPVPPLSLVAHSAGSIYASHLLTYFDDARNNPASALHASPLRFDKLTFLAPACRFTVFDQVLTRHAARPLFNQFRMFGLTDDDELGYYEVPAVYPGSLLYLVSGLFEDEEADGEADCPLVGMQRYRRTRHPYAEPEVRRVVAFLEGAADRLVLSGEDRGDGLRCDSRKHGAFDDSPQTIASFLHFVTR